MSSRTELYDDVVDFPSLSALDVVAIKVVVLVRLLLGLVVVVSFVVGLVMW